MKLIKKQNLGKKYLVVLLIAILFIKLNKKMFFFFLFLFIATSIKYIRVNMNLPLSIEPVLFFSLLLTKSYGLIYGISLIVFSIILVDVVNARFSNTTLITISVNSLVNTIFSLIKSELPLWGILASLLNTSFSFVMGILLGAPKKKLITMPTSSFVVNCTYFLSLGKLLYGILN